MRNGRDAIVQLHPALCAGDGEQARLRSRIRVETRNPLREKNAQFEHPATKPNDGGRHQTSSQSPKASISTLSLGQMGGP